jgi:hypothetical protein
MPRGKTRTRLRNARWTKPLRGSVACIEAVVTC